MVMGVSFPLHLLRWRRLAAPPSLWQGTVCPLWLSRFAIRQWGHESSLPYRERQRLPFCSIFGGFANRYVAAATTAHSRLYPLAPHYGWPSGFPPYNTSTSAAGRNHKTNFRAPTAPLWRCLSSGNSRGTSQPGKVEIDELSAQQDSVYQKEADVALQMIHDSLEVSQLQFLEELDLTVSRLIWMLK
eukprot:GHVT01012120.1.p1 GENE.GHVT01012120.1~~GHVT01012120.1.p1  ORF type:complete len:187 (+),score=12.25 GHVT01012120.1:273-833(+)